MPSMTIKRALTEELGDLKKKDFKKFCHHLRDRREEPRITRSDVEDQDVLSITDVLVSKFTERKALKVTLDTLEEIGCNEEAKRLDARTKACVDNGDPALPRASSGRLQMKPSQEALTYAAGQGPMQDARRGSPPVKNKEEVEAEAKAHVRSEGGGDPSNAQLVLSGFTIQFGKYKGKTFKWLLENDVGYVAYIVASHQLERGQGNTMCQTPLMANKRSLEKYATAYPEVLDEVRRSRSVQSVQNGEALLGFGKYKKLKLRSLYQSKDSEKISYVNYLRGMKSKCDPGSKMEVAVQYILKRDREQAAGAARKSTTRSARQAVTNGPRDMSPKPQRPE
uniref:uncharacterized protein LOC124065002 n=1 Tax=Scatophagus argus TaxID=75038 RepID=UPI001ED858BF|nr:uncharacterized protein LOC124065002 [Scatophagus argus]